MTGRRTKIYVRTAAPREFKYEAHFRIYVLTHDVSTDETLDMTSETFRALDSAYRRGRPKCPTRPLGLELAFNSLLYARQIHVN